MGGLRLQGSHLETESGLLGGHRGQKEEAWAEGRAAAQGSTQKELPIKVVLGGNELPIPGGIKKQNKTENNLLCWSGGYRENSCSARELWGSRSELRGRVSKPMGAEQEAHVRGLHRAHRPPAARTDHQDRGGIPWNAANANLLIIQNPN